MAKTPKIDAEIIEAGGAEHIVYSDIPLEWFSDERGVAAMQLAKARARARKEGRKLEN